MEVQVRTVDDELLYFSSIKEVLINCGNFAKISWFVGDNQFRFRAKTKRAIWGELSENKLCRLSLTYSVETDLDRIFWVNQLTLSPIIGKLTMDLMDKKITPKEFDAQNYESLICEILTTEEFMAKYC